MMKLFDADYGIIVACDVKNLERLEELVDKTSGVDCVKGYKIGPNLCLKYSIGKVVDSVLRSRKRRLPIIYDHEKLGSGLKERCREIIDDCNDVDAVIIFPFAGDDVLKDSVGYCQKVGLTPIVGGELTQGDGVKNPEEKFKIAGKLGVEYFVFPSTKPEICERYKLAVLGEVQKPKFMFVGTGYQGGKLLRMLNLLYPYPSYTIIGRDIYRSRDIFKKTTKICDVISNFKGL